MGDKKRQRPTSQKKIDANRRNAKHSSGPTSAEGKAKSAQNARRHGAYGRDDLVLSSGPFRQDRAAAYERMNDFLEALDLEGPIEARLGMILATTMEKMELVEVWGAAQAEGAGAIDMFTLDLHTEARETDAIAELKLQVSAMVQAWANDELDWWAEAQGITSWRPLAESIKETLIPEGLLPGVWTEDLVPADEAGWREAIELILTEQFPNRDDAPQGVFADTAQAVINHKAADRRLKAAIAPRLLTTVVDLERPQNHLMRRYFQVSRELAQVQALRRGQNED